MSLSSPKVLAIDDEPLVRESIVAFLEDSGFDVLEAENGREGLDVYYKNMPDLVLCDLDMPVMSGLEVLTSLREDGEGVPFIVVSGAGVVHDAVNALRLGAWDYIVKPITDMGTLEHAICQALDKARLLRENQLYREELEVTNRELKESLGILKEDQEAGRCIQFQLLPEKSLAWGEYSFSHHIIPSLYLSGDFVDYFKISERYIGFYIADVSGHGAPSAFVTVLLKSLVDQFVNRFQGMSTDIILNPDKLLRKLSHEILRARLGKYLTMFYGVIDCEQETLTYSIGGHFPNPIVVCPELKPYFLQGTGFPVGVFDKADYAVETIKIGKDFRLVMFSDGVLEILKQEALEDKENFLLSLVDKKNNSSTQSLLESLGLSHVHEMPDDITILILQRQ